MPDLGNPSPTTRESECPGGPPIRPQDAAQPLASRPEMAGGGQAAPCRARCARSLLFIDPGRGRRTPRSEGIKMPRDPIQALYFLLGLLLAFTLLVPFLERPTG
jgi:hypothetical protein